MNMKISIIVVAFVAAIGFMVFSNTGEQTHPHFQLNEFYDLKAKDAKKVSNRFMTVYGDVKEGTIKKKGVEADFIIEKDGLEMKIFFTGKNLMPDTFEDGAIVSLDGEYDPEKDLFVADKIMAKCASRYEANLTDTK